MHRNTGVELHAAFLKGEHSAEKIVRHFLSRIKKFDKDVGAFLAVYEERALAQAKALDQKKREGKPLGKLAAIPMALKDNIHVKGELTTCASKFLTNYRAPFNATVTELLEAEDAIIIGKTNLDEFAMGSSNEYSALQVTRNPWNLSCVPGGSSGGSGAAVGARLVPIAFGSDTGGSVRLPAAFCGVFGYKPTYGRVSRYGLVAYGSSLDQIGPIATSAEDIALVMEVIGRHDPKDATSLHKHPDDYQGELKASIDGKKVGVPWSFLKDLPMAARLDFEASLKRLEKLGCESVEVDLDILRYSIATYYIVAGAEASTNLARFDGIRYGVRASEATTLDQVYSLSKGHGFGREVKKRILIGTYVLSSGYQDAYYKRATKVRVKIREAFEKAFEKVDVIALPSSSGPAFGFGAISTPIDLYLQDIFMIGANLASLPAISIPSGFTQEEMPMSLQLVAAIGEDRLLARFAKNFSEEAGAHRRCPPLFDKEVKDE